jgi:hypothetical protein
MATGLDEVHKAADILLEETRIHRPARDFRKGPNELMN